MSAPAFTPAWWLPSPHLQTLWGSLCRTAPNCSVGANVCGWTMAIFSTWTGMARMS